jgi:vacuolar-type H+-ATPase subunit E/Vma4
MPSRKPRNAELAQAVDNLSQAARHVRNAMQGKVDEVRGAAAAELAKAKAAARRKTDSAHEKVESVLNRAEARLHRLVARAQRALDDAVRKAEKRYPGSVPAKKSAAKKAAASEK